MCKVIDLKGQKYGSLKVIERAPSRKVGGARWLCLCECGNLANVSARALKTGNTKSCGCKSKIAQFKYPLGPYLCQHPLYRVWHAMWDRCENFNNPDYKNYGGRGIRVCDEWRNSFSKFLEAMGQRPPNTMLERIDNNGHYEPGNCKWATSKEQTRNMRKNVFLTFGGNTMILQDWAEKLGVHPRSIVKYLNRGKSMDYIVNYFS